MRKGRPRRYTASLPLSRNLSLGSSVHRQCQCVLGDARPDDLLPVALSVLGKKKRPHAVPTPFANASAAGCENASTHAHSAAPRGHLPFPVARPSHGLHISNSHHRSSGLFLRRHPLLPCLPARKISRTSRTIPLRSVRPKPPASGKSAQLAVFQPKLHACIIGAASSPSHDATTAPGTPTASLSSAKRTHALISRR